MKKPTRKRWLSSDEILQEIERKKLEAKKLLELADSIEQEARRLMEIPNMSEDAKHKLRECDKLRSSSRSITDTTMARLKQKLAEFLTPPLPGCGIEDRSIQRV